MVARSRPSIKLVEIRRDPLPLASEATIHSSRAVAEFLRSIEIDRRDREVFGAIHLDCHHRPISYELVSVGSLVASLVHPREVFKAAILANAAALIVFHNHPSGSPSPSPEDKAVTERLVEAGRLLGINVLDHVILAGSEHYSFADARLVPFAIKM